jgi:hypothetical protein
MSSSNNTNRTNTNNQNNTPFCKVCKDAGKSIYEYSTHWVKTMKGDVCCPTLLTQSCRYCGNNGHTVKFCKVLEKEQHTVQRNTNEKKFNEAKQISTTPKPTKSSNVFASLYSSDESEDERPKTKKRKMTKPTKTEPEPTPVHTKKIQSKSDILILSYASILSKEPTTAPIAPIAPIEPIEPIQMPVQFPKCLLGKKSTFCKNWADAVSDDEEE